MENEEAAGWFATGSFFVAFSDMEEISQTRKMLKMRMF